MKKKLRLIEEKVLRQLEKDSRRSFSNIGKKIRKSQQQVSYTVNALKGKSILNSLFTIVDYSKLDIISFCVYFKISYINKKNLEDFIAYLCNDVHTSWIATCSGKYDLICTFLSKNPSQFNKILKSIIKMFSKEIADYTVLTTIVNRWFGRKYLFKEYHLEEIIFGGDREPEEISKKNLLILNEISKDARISSVTVANKLSTTPKTVIRSIKELEKKGLILGYKPSLNIRNMNMISKLILIRYHNSSLDLEDNFLNFLKNHPNIISISKTLGEWDIEIEVEAKNSMDFRMIEMELRERFALLIKEIENFSVFRVLKRRYFPGFLLD